MSRTVKIVAPILVLLALAACVPWGMRAWRAHQRTVAVEGAREEACLRLGLRRMPDSAFVALPRTLLYHEGRAHLGRRLFSDPRLASTRWRACVICHTPEKGGTDLKVHAGLLTRPFKNAVLGTVLLQDGRATNLTEAVRVMIEDGRFCAGGSLSNVTARLAKDSGLVRSFQSCYEDGLSETNVLESIVEYGRTQLLSGCIFDAWCANGQKDGLDEAQKAGLAIFEAHRCTDCHEGPALGALKTHGGKRVIGLRGLPLRNVYLSNGSCSDLGAVFSLMPGGEMEGDERISLLAFLKTL